MELDVSVLKIYWYKFASTTVSFVQLIITKMETFSAFFSETGKSDSSLLKSQKKNLHFPKELRRNNVWDFGAL